jgi:DNA-binding response OmpR family regulator
MGRNWTEQGQNHLEADAVRFSRKTATASITSTSEITTMARILVVDDEESLLKLYQKELQDDGHEVKTAINAQDALEYFRNDRPDLVVLDIRLPGMDGLEAVGHFMSIDRGVPVVFNTAYPSFKDNFLSWIADAYVDKSSDLDELKRTIKGLLSARVAA